MGPSQGFRDYERQLIEKFLTVNVPQALGSHDVVCNEEFCMQFAKSILVVEDLALVDNQGSNSCTLISRQISKTIQFRLQPFNTEMLDLAHQIYGDQVPCTVLRPGFPLPVYSSAVIPGKAHVLQDFPYGPFPLRKTAQDNYRSGIVHSEEHMAPTVSAVPPDQLDGYIREDC